MGAVANNQLEDLGTRFNTINGTPTVTFTATHFSPYVIYADTNNLVASEMLDASPKTGDPIHPKWFLAIALFAYSINSHAKERIHCVALFLSERLRKQKGRSIIVYNDALRGAI